jgi:hypothetical protein
VTEPALSIALFDPTQGLHVSARAGTTLLFEQGGARVLDDGPYFQREGDGWSVELEGSLALRFEPVAEPAPLGPLTAHLCSVEGEAAGRHVSCLGTVGETDGSLEWRELDALRSVSAIFDSDHALLALARRPRGAPGHGSELVSAWLLAGGKAVPVEEARISTVYDGDGRQRSAGLELWIDGEDFPRRCSGAVAAGSSLALDGLDVHAAVFRWRMEGRDGAGAYELWARARSEAA